jgi:hypothetical protein
MQNKITVNIKWKDSCPRGRIEVAYGKLDHLSVGKGGGIVFKDGSFECTGQGAELLVVVADTSVAPGAFAGIIRVKSNYGSFSFFLRDALNSEHPIYISEYGIVATAASDSRAYDEVVAAVVEQGLFSDFEKFEMEPEESYDSACASDNRKQFCPTWLTVPRDMRIFRVGVQNETQARQFGYWGQIVPANHSREQQIEGQSGKESHYITFEIGQGVSCKRPDITRWLEERTLPILHGTQREAEICYNLTFFATLEASKLEEKNIRGTDALLAYSFMEGNMLSVDECAQKMSQAIEDSEQGEQVVLCGSIEAVNLGRVPRYAWFKLPHSNMNEAYESKSGFSIYSEKVCSITRFENNAAPQEEMAVLLQPGQKVRWEFYIPHTPISIERATAMNNSFDFAQKLSETREFWSKRLAQAALFDIPEKPINELLKAGVLHCDIAAIGRDPDGAVGATVGWYTPIGSESSPIIQYFDSVGLHKLAERCIDFFLVRQNPNGFIQNFNNYQLETGPVLWTMGEHFRYTHDEIWLKRVKPQLDKAVDYLLKWRERNKKEELRLSGCYGLLDGKVADPNDFYYSFMLNGVSYLGLKRAAEMYEVIDSDKAEILNKELEEYRQDIRTGYYYALANSPVMPVGNGTWAPLPPPWVKDNGALCLYADGEKCFTHGSFISRDTIIGATYLVIGEVLEPEEIGTTLMLKANQTPITIENAALTQPYYCRHDYAHIKRNEIKPFLKTYYNQLTGLIDRETYTFWEHYFHESQHKTHEEGWFLMQTRWMLYMEEGDCLKLFPAIPRAWLASGKNLKVSDVASYFGKLTFCAKVSSDGMTIKASVKCIPEAGQTLPDHVIFRLPHAWKRTGEISGGKYDEEKQTVRVDNFTGSADVIIQAYGDFCDGAETSYVDSNVEFAMNV